MSSYAIHFNNLILNFFICKIEIAILISEFCLIFFVVFISVPTQEKDRDNALKRANHFT